MLTKIEDVEMLDSSKMLGEGAYSTVYKVRSKKNNKVYALKKVGLEDKGQRADAERHPESQGRD